MSDADRQLSFGIKTSQIGLGYDEIVATWREADEIEAFEHAWLWDHMVPLRGDARADALEAWTLLAALAAQTQRLRLGVIVTSNRLRQPTVLAKMAATVDVIAGGRLVFGIGAGGALPPGVAAQSVQDHQPVVREHLAYGIPLVPVAEAIADLDEACTLIKRMWTESDPFDFDGRHAELRHVVCEPKPRQAPHPPIMIGAGGERLSLRVVAKHADLWSCPSRTVEEFRHKSAVLDRHCAAVDRDAAEIVRSIQLMIGPDQVAEPEATRDLLLQMVDAGVRHVVLVPHASGRPLAWLVDEIVGPVRARAAIG